MESIFMQEALIIENWYWHIMLTIKCWLSLCQKWLIFCCHGYSFLHCTSFRVFESERGTVTKILVASPFMILIEKFKLFWKCSMLGNKELLITHFGQSMSLVCFCMNTHFQGRPDIGLFSQGFAHICLHIFCTAELFGSF